MLFASSESLKTRTPITKTPPKIDVLKIRLSQVLARSGRNIFKHTIKTLIKNV
jgi:hypothetical protein